MKTEYTQGTLLEQLRTTQSAIEMIERSIAQHRRWSDDEYVRTETEKQQEIIDAAKRQIERIEARRDDAPAKIEELQRSLRFKKKRLVHLKNNKLIKKYLELQAQLEKLKETTDEERVSA